MRQFKRTDPVILVLLCCFTFISQLYGQDLKPHNVIIRSSFQEQSEIPTFVEHAYELTNTSEVLEPFIPPFYISDFDFAEAFSLNIVLSGLTKSFGELSEFFLGDRGILENAYLLYSMGDYEQAEAKLQLFSEKDTDLAEKATLLLAWSHFKNNRMPDAFREASRGFSARQIQIARESFFLASLILYNQKSWKPLIDLYRQHVDQKQADFWDSRFCLIQLFALASLKQWKTAEDFFNQIDQVRFAHARQYYKFKEFAAVISYHRKQYRESLKEFQEAGDLHPTINYQKKINRRLGWLHYILGDYQNVVELVSQFQSRGLIDNNVEISYLTLASLAHLQQFEELKPLFDAIPQQSEFYNYAAFEIQILSDGIRLDPELQGKLKNIHYDFPEMKFQSALQKGNQAFKKKKNYDEAENFYFNALSADVNDADYYLAQFNLGLTHLKKTEFNKAKAVFTDLIQSLPKSFGDILQYHLLFTLYQLKSPQEYLTQLKSLNLLKLSPQKQWEIQFMQGNMLAALNRDQEASALFLNLWQQTHKIEAFESALNSIYKSRDYTYLLQLIAKNPQLTSESIFLLEIRSLLATQQKKLALEKTEKADYQSDRFIEVKLEVWMANDLYQRVIAYVSRLLSQDLPQNRRLLYYLSLGDAHFNLQQYQESKNQFYKALSLTNDPLKRSLVQYNIALVTFYTKDYLSFVKETKLILEHNQLTPEIRYNLTQLLVDYYRQDKQLAQADEILGSYIAKYEFQRAKANLKRIQLHYSNQSYQKCYELAGQKETLEDFYQRRDRLILFGYCGNQSHHESTVIDKIKTELSGSPNPYRQPEMTFILSQANFNLGHFDTAYRYITQIPAKDLDKEALFKTRLLKVDTLIHLKKLDQAKNQLGGINQYRSTEYYSSALKLNAELDAGQGQVDASVKALLRIYYLPSSTNQEKQLALLRVSEILNANHRIEDAQTYFEKIESDLLIEDKPANQRYQKLKTELKSSSEPLSKADFRHF